MWCTQSKHNFTGSEFAWDADYLLDPGFECACPNRACCWDRANTLRHFTDPGCVTGAHLLLVGPPPYGHHLRTGKHPGCCYWRREGPCSHSGEVDFHPPGQDLLFSEHTVFFTPARLCNALCSVGELSSLLGLRTAKWVKSPNLLTQDRGRIWT